MPFRWRTAPENLEQRFHEAVNADLEAFWRTLIEDLSGRDTGQDGYLGAFDRFLDAVSALPPKVPPDCRVFISHQRKDERRAEYIAYVATTHKFDYWLDVHDPGLALANQSLSPNDPRYGILIAAIIEIGLLNSTHVVAVHTDHSLASKWVPYEFGRAKARRIYSTQAAGWFAPGLSPTSCGEYVQLASIVRGGKTELDIWFNKQKQGRLAAGQMGCRPSSHRYTPPFPPEKWLLDPDPDTGSSSR
jgi:hypothetical protein